MNGARSSNIAHSLSRVAYNTPEVCAPMHRRSQAMQIHVATFSSMVGRKRSRAEEPRPSLSAHQVVAYNFARAREAAGWTQVETSERLEPFLGYKLNQAGVSAIERTFDSERRRNIDVAEIVAFARCFGVPLGWFFVPPAGHATDFVEP